MQKKVLFVVPDGTGIKNYLFSDILPQLAENNVEVLVYHNLSDNAILEVEKQHNIKLTHQKTAVYHETKKQKFYREAIAYARLLHNAKLVNNPTILTNWNRNHAGVKKIFYKWVEAYGQHLSKNYSRILKAEKVYQKLVAKSTQKEIVFLKQYQPTSVFCTHQRALTAIPIIEAAHQLGIKTIGAIYSWDNLPKARLAVRTSTYLVWSDYMKKELQLYYPEIEENNIQVTGTPQFELYATLSANESKSDFFEKYGLSVNKKTICFSGDDEKTSPYDPKYLEDLAKSIVENNASEKYQIIFRRCPVDLSGRYDKVLEKYKNIIVPIAPQWSNTQEQWTQLYPYTSDVQLLANIGKHSDVVVNLGSTMAFDFSYFNKPAIYLNYNPVVSDKWSVQTIYKYQHFRSMPSKKAVYWINHASEIFKIIEEAIEQGMPMETKQWFEIVNRPHKRISETIAHILIAV